MMLRVALVAVLLAVPRLAVGGDNWASVKTGGPDDEVQVIEVDMDRIERSGKVLTAWSRTIYRKAFPYAGQDRTFTSTKALNYINCLDRTIALRFMVFYVDVTQNISLDSVDVQLADLRFRPAVPESVGDELIEGVCRAARTRDAAAPLKREAASDSGR